MLQLTACSGRDISGAEKDRSNEHEVNDSVIGVLWHPPYRRVLAPPLPRRRHQRKWQELEEEKFGSRRKLPSAACPTVAEKALGERRKLPSSIVCQRFYGNARSGSFRRLPTAYVSAQHTSLRLIAPEIAEGDDEKWRKYPR